MTEEVKKLKRFPLIPDKRYFTISDVSEWCGLEQHVLRYWEQVFRQLKPVRRGGRRFYTKENLLTIKKIYTLLKDEGYTIEGAKRKVNSDEPEHKSRDNDFSPDEVIKELQDILDNMK